MKAEELRTLQAPIKQKYKDDPGAALVTLRSRGQLGEGLTCRVETARAVVEAGHHPATGGTGLEVCSGEMLLDALVACAGVTMRSVATALGIQLRHGAVTVEGDLDFRGTLGVAKDAPVGFREIRLRFEIESDATPEQREKLRALTERYCVVYQTLCGATPMSLSFA
jgi:uncharacterized OsmC-like protein